MSIPSSPDWRTYVREHLDLDGLTPERQVHLVRDIAAQLDDCYQDALARGLSPDAAADHTRQHITDWDAFASSIVRASSRHRATPRVAADAGPSTRQKAGTMDLVVREFRFAARSLMKRPGFLAVALLTLGLGIGATTSIFGVVRGVLLSPLPYAEPDRLVIVWGQLLNRDILKFPVSPPDLRDYQSMSGVFADVAGVAAFSQPLTDGDSPPEQIQVAGVTPNFHAVAGIAPLHGRGFTPDDAAPVPPDTDPAATPDESVILGHGFWQRRFGGSLDVLNRTVEIGGQTRRIVGIMPESMRLYFSPAYGNLPSQVDAWITPRLDVDGWGPRRNVFWNVVGRLGEGVTVAQAQSALDQFATRMRAEEPIFETAGYHLQVTPIQEELTAEVRPVLLTLLGAVGFVLLIACANVANLLLVRASAREREIAVRTALGAARGRLMWQLFAESLLLGLGGAVLGVALAVGGLELLVALQPANLPRLDTLAIDGTVLAFTVVIAVAAAVVFGMAPALRASSPKLASALADRTVAATNRGHRVFRSGLIVAETALAIVLLVGAGLMVRSFVSLLNVEPGFDADNLLTFEVALPPATYDNAQRIEFQRRFAAELAALPGVTGVTAAFPFPFQGQSFNGRYGPEAALTDESLYGQADYRVVLPDYFETMGTRLLAGRAFTQAEYDNEIPVAVIDETVARVVAPDGSAIGRRVIVRTGGDPEPVEVIGVVAHERAHTLSGPEIETIYLTQGYVAPTAGGPLTNIGWLVRTASDPASHLPAVRQTLAALDGQLPIASAEPMRAKLDEARTPTRFALVLIGVFGLVGLTLAAVGLYGVLASVVRHRTNEIGLRMALGASAWSVVWLVVRQGLVLTVAGLAIGLLISVWAAGFLSQMLVGVGPHDPATLAGIAAVFLTVAAVACFVPARRATRIDPLTALRNEH